jgi:chromosome segregation ATPase
MSQIPLLKTGVDRLVSLIKERKRISVPQAAKELGVSPVVVEEWADFLEEDDVISIDYKFATPWLIEKKLKKEEILKKVKEFHGKKEVIVRKSESLLSFLDKEGKDITKIREEFRKIKEDIHAEAENVEKEVKELERYEELKKKVDDQVKKQDQAFADKIKQMDGQITRAQKKYSEVLKEIGAEEKIIKTERLKTDSIRKTEEVLKQKIKKIEGAIDKFKQKIKSEDTHIEDIEHHIKKLKELAENTKESINLQKKRSIPMVKESKEYEKKVLQSQKEILKKVFGRGKIIKRNIAKGKRLSDRFKEFFEKKMETANLMEKINDDRNSLKKELNEFIARAKAFSISSHSADIQKQIDMMEKKFKEIDSKKNIFEKEISKLSSLIKKKNI